MADQQCEAETNSGDRCKRVAKVTLRRSWEERVFLFFYREVEAFDHLCNQHADKSRVGEVVEGPKFRTLLQLKKAVKKAGICSKLAYQKESPRHSDWPGNPRVHYGDEWISWYNLFGRKGPEFRTLPQLKKAVKKAGKDLMRV